jgi:hypothetical protein
MCWVMPPASPDTTLVLRMASSSEVLPWSTWPMMVTTGGRGQILVGVGRVEQAFLDVGFRHALDGVAHFLGDELGGVGVDHVGDLVHLALLHQELDDVDRALGHAVGEFLDGDRTRARARASRSSSVKVRSTTPVWARGAAGLGSGAATRGLAAGAVGATGAAGLASATGAAGAAAGGCGA